MCNDLILFVKLLIFRFLIALCTFSASHPDELWQFHEPAHVKVFSRGHLSWDWRAGIRSFVFPLPLILAFQIAKLIGGGTEDFIVHYAPIFIKSIWAALTDLFTYKLGRKYFGPLAGKWALLFTLSNPAQADIGTRALSNSVETALCAAVASIWPMRRKDWSAKRWSLALCILGLTCLVRISAVQMFLPASLFLFLYAPNPVEVILIAIPLMTTVVSFGIAIDSFFYGKFTVSWWNFFQWNIVQNISSLFGVEPFYFYFGTLKSVLLRSALPFTIFGLGNSFYRFKSFGPFLLFVLPYFVFSSVQPHKEHRFLLPILPILLAYAAHGGQQLEVWALKKRSKFINFSMKLFLMAMVAFNCWEIVKLISFQAVGPWNTIQDLKIRVKTAIAIPQEVEGILLLANCHNFPNYGVFHLDYPLTFISCPPPFTHRFFKQDPDYDLNNAISSLFYSEMIKEAAEYFIQNSKMKPPAYIVLPGHKYLDKIDQFRQLGYDSCGRHVNYILDALKGRDSSYNDIYILCHSALKF